MAQSRRKPLDATDYASKPPKTPSPAAAAAGVDTRVGIACRLSEPDRIRLRQLALSRGTTVQALLEQAVMQLLNREG